MDDRPQTLQRVQEVSEFGPFVVVLTHFRCGAGCCRKVAGVEVGGGHICNLQASVFMQNCAVGPECLSICEELFYLGGSSCGSSDASAKRCSIKTHALVVSSVVVSLLAQFCHLSSDLGRQGSTPM